MQRRIIGVPPISHLFSLLFLLVCCAICCGQETDSGKPDADITIRGATDDSEIVITTTARLAGAIHSLTYRGQEFIDSADHGRQLQSASNFDYGSRFKGETFNPTEAGSRLDGAGATSTSRLLHSLATENSLQTTNQMAFWLAPGEKSGGEPAKNKTLLSNHLLTKRVTIGFQDLKNVIDYHVTFSIPIDEQHRYAQFEALTGYMPSKFEKFLAFHPEKKELIELNDGPGEQRYPVILATSDHRLAMGVFSPDQPSKGFEHAGYGRFRFAKQKVTKWNCVFRIRSADSIQAGDYSYQCLVIVGNLNEVTDTMATLHKRFANPD